MAYNVSPISFDKYDSIGREVTYVTDKQTITDVIGEVNGDMSISSKQAGSLENAMGLEKGSLAEGFKIRENNLSGMDSARIQVATGEGGNQFFKGVNEHLPGGGPELILNPRVSTKDNAEVTTMATVHVH